MVIINYLRGLFRKPKDLYLRNLSWYRKQRVGDFFHNAGIQYKLLGFNGCSGKIIFRANNHGLFYQIEKNHNEIKS